VNHQIVVKPYGKTGENHEIILDQGTIAILRSWRSFQNQERLAQGASHECVSPEPDCEMKGYHIRDLVFARPDGDYLHPEQFSREFKRAQRRYNRDNPDEQLPDISLHALRHGWATVALEAGVPMKVVQDRLNHASERITADIYTHVRAPLQSDAAERVAMLLLPAPDA
jgi:integrase